MSFLTVKPNNKKNTAVSPTSKLTTTPRERELSFLTSPTHLGVQHHVDVDGYDVASTVVGSGNFGKVFRCASTAEPHRTLAMKIVDVEPHVRQSDAAQRLARAEIDNLRGLHHPNVLKMVDFKYIGSCECGCGQTTQVAIVTNYCEYGDLNALIVENEAKGTQLSWRRAGTIAHGLASALRYIHRKHIIHRDIKPANVLFSDAKRRVPILADFGVSVLFTKDEVKTRTCVGALRYMAPELLVDERYDRLVDCWSLGVLVVDMLVGRNEECSQRLRKLNADEQTEAVRECAKLIKRRSSKLASFVTDALQFDYNRRASAATLFTLSKDLIMAS